MRAAGTAGTCSCAAQPCAERNAPLSRPPALDACSGAALRSSSVNADRPPRGAPPSLKSRAMFFLGRDSGMSSTCSQGGGNSAPVMPQHRQSTAERASAACPGVESMQLVFAHVLHVPPTTTCEHTRRRASGKLAASARRATRRRETDTAWLEWQCVATTRRRDAAPLTS